MMSEFRSEEGKDCVLQLHDIPGGAKAFELVAKFCYDIKIELNALNVVSLRCAAEHLLMTEDYVGGNLIMQTENFLVNQVFGSWKDSVKALEACESVLPHAEELHIVSRCINSLASKACADPSLFSWPMVGHSTTSKSPEGSSSILWNGIVAVGETPRSGIADWWYEDVSFLSLPLFKRLILAVESNGMKPENVAGALMFYAKRFLPGLSRNLSFLDGTTRIPPGTSVSAPSESDQRVFLEEIVDLLPMKKGVTSTKFLLGMLRTAMILRADSWTSLHDSSSGTSMPRTTGCQAYPCLITVSHPWLTESEKEQLCRLMNCQKLSLEACTHAAQNERLPLRVVVQVLFFEQLRLRTSIAGWFFVSDNMENSQAPHGGNLMLQKNSSRAIHEDSNQEQEDDHHDMRLRVMELENECLSMKQEIEKLGKPKSSWNIFSRKCSIGSKSRSVTNSK
ncbi:hypothetical protein C4D60_Mb09t18640 [Musa balbisiana]|uniref:NPH3 domain-containing protein n=1 Tax=Musa balbisiana TaxID=52838 RepID=A0A4S8IHF9_MUSBA|nr:hypothetical protein C4D60_Mb09t18640 [Musa balbisiana]